MIDQMTINEMDMAKNTNENAISFKNEIHLSNSSVSLVVKLSTLFFLFVALIIVITRKAGRYFFDFNLSIAKNHANETRE